MATSATPSGAEPPPKRRAIPLTIPAELFLEEHVRSDPATLAAAFLEAFPGGRVQVFPDVTLRPLPLSEAEADEAEAETEAEACSPEDESGLEAPAEAAAEEGSPPSEAKEAEAAEAAAEDEAAEAAAEDEAAEAAAEYFTWPDSALDPFATGLPSSASGASARPPAGRRVIVLAAHKGMGKSKAIRQAVRELGSDWTCLNVTFRRSLARGAAADFPRGVVYLDLPGTDTFDARRHPVLTVLINSLARVRVTASARYDLVVLDEWVSILEMLGGDLLDGGARLDILRTLLAALHHARTVLVSDALLDGPSLRALAACLDASPVATTVRLLHYPHANHADHEYVAHPSEEAWTAALVASVRAGRRVVVPCMTRAQTLRLHARLTQREGVSPARALAYVAGGEHDLVHHMAHLHTIWRGVDVLLYSPVITAGCSFEERGHFDECFLYAFQGTASPRAALQMTFRVRDLAARRIHVWVARGQRGWGDAAAADRMAARIVRNAAPAADGCALSGTPKGSAGPKHSRAAITAAHDAIMRTRGLVDIERAHCFSLAFWRLVAQSGVQLRWAGARATMPDAGAQLHLHRALTQQAAKAVAQRRLRGGVAPTRPWQESDLAEQGIVAWAGPAWEDLSSGPPHPLAAAHDRLAMEFDPDEWHLEYVRALAEALRQGDVGEGAADIAADLYAASSSLAAGAASTAAKPLALSAALASTPGRWRALLSGPGAALRWLPSCIGMAGMQLLAERSGGNAAAFFVHGAVRLSRLDLLDALAVRAVFAWAISAAASGAPMHEAVRVRFVVANADASVAFAREGLVRPGDVWAAMDEDTRRPRCLPAFYPPEAPHTFDPARHVAAVTSDHAGGAGGGPEPGLTPYAIRPVDPTLPPLHGGSWSHPLSMLQALCTGDSHALLFTGPAAEPVAVRCRPMFGFAPG